MSQAGDLFDRAKLTSTFTGKQRWWLGLSDFIREGVWHWSYSYDAAVNVSEFASIWEPNLEDGNTDDCVVMALVDGSLSWVDIPCLDTSHDGQDIQAICQCKGTSCVSPTTETTPATTMETTTVHACAEGWSPTETLGCVIALSEPAASLVDARAACSSVNGYLVEALNNDNEAELETVAEVLHSVLAPWSWWLGLVWDGSAWVWIDALQGLTTDDKWGTDQGTGNNGEECAVITKVGTKWEWHDVACNSSEYLGVSIGVICQECTEGHCAPTTTSATTAPTENPCQDMTVADCTLRPDNIIGTFPFPVAEICESSCDTADTCMFWRFFKNDTVTECLHLSTNYHQDCLTFAGPTLGDIVACTEVDLATCSAYIGEECEYSGDRLEDFEPQPGQVASIAACQAWAMPLEGYGVHYFVFDGITEECMLYSTLQADCSVIGGPRDAPPLAECS